MPTKRLAAGLPPQVPHDVAAIRRELDAFLRSKDHTGRPIGSAACGVYVFYDYDGEPIYVGKTYEKLSGRISRHLTNRRTDAVAMNVLDPFEVADVEVYPFFDLERIAGESKEAWIARLRPVLASGESTVYQRVREKSVFKAVLNEKIVPEAPQIDLPRCYRGRIIPEPMFELRNHPDIRIARRATTIAALARIISERQVNKGLRVTLDTQAKRLAHLVQQRLNHFASEPVEFQTDDRDSTDLLDLDD